MLNKLITLVIAIGIGAVAAQRGGGESFGSQVVTIEGAIGGRAGLSAQSSGHGEQANDLHRDKTSNREARRANSRLELSFCRLRRETENYSVE